MQTGYLPWTVQQNFRPQRKVLIKVQSSSKKSLLSRIKQSRKINVLEREKEKSVELQYRVEYTRSERQKSLNTIRFRSLAAAPVEVFPEFSDWSKMDYGLSNNPILAPSASLQQNNRNKVEVRVPYTVYSIPLDPFTSLFTLVFSYRHSFILCHPRV